MTWKDALQFCITAVDKTKNESASLVVIETQFENDVKKNNAEKRPLQSALQYFIKTIFKNS